MLQFIVDKKISSTQSSNHLGTNPYRDVVEPYPGGILASESETIPLAVMSTSPQRPTSICNPSTSHQDPRLTYLTLYLLLFQDQKMKPDTNWLKTTLLMSPERPRCLKLRHIVWILKSAGGIKCSRMTPDIQNSNYRVAMLLNSISSIGCQTTHTHTHTHSVSKIENWLL